MTKSPEVLKILCFQCFRAFFFFRRSGQTGAAKGKNRGFFGY